MKTTSFAISALVAAGFSLAPPASGQTDDSKLGKVHFDTSCKPGAQRLFDRAMLYQHSFWYRASQRVFEDALKADPGCAIAYWGVALSLLWNPHVPPPAKNLADGAAALARPKPWPPRPNASAITSIRSALCTPTSTRSITARACWPTPRRWSSSPVAIRPMTRAQIYYALALNTSAAPADKTYASQLKGAAILELIAKRQPEHPGVAHYLIHLYDAPAIADRGLEVARRYAKIAPAAAHACTCRRTFSRGSAIGRSRSPPISDRGESRRKAKKVTTSCMPWTISSMPISSLGWTGKPAT